MILIISVTFLFAPNKTLTKTTLKELKEDIRQKTMELELAAETGGPRKEQLKIYNELKELQYRKVQAELKPE